MTDRVRDALWSRRDDDMLREMTAAGDSVRTIAKELARSEAAVRKRATKIGVKLAVKKPSLWTPEEYQRLKRLARSGFSNAEIATQMNRSRGSIRSQAEKLHISVAREGNGMRAPVSRLVELGLKVKGK